MLKEQERLALESVPETASHPQPVTLVREGHRLYAMYHPPKGAPRPGQRVAVLVLEQLGPHRLNVRVTRALAAAGYAVLAVEFQGQGESEGADPPHGERHEVPPHMIEAGCLALAELRRLASPDRIVVFGACQAGHAATWCAVTDGHVDGLILPGITQFDEFFRATYRGILPGLAPVHNVPDLGVFDTLANWAGSVLLIHGSADQYVHPNRLLDFGERWVEAAPDRHLEMRVLEGSDHAFTARPREQVVIAETVGWLERRFGPGYPRAWQGPPPTAVPAPRPRDDSVEAQVPLLATGTLVVPEPSPSDVAPAWRLVSPDDRFFALTDPFRRLVALVDGRRSNAQISAELSRELGRTISPDQVAAILRDRLQPLGLVAPDGRGDGGEVESGMTDILIRCYQAGDRLRALLDNLTRVTHSPYNVILVVGKRHCVLNQNVALERARTRYAVFLDDDILLTDGWLEKLRETMDRTGAGAVSARQLRLDGTPLASAAACAPGEIAEICFGGACFMFRNDIGLRFDERYVRSQWDDFDFIFQVYERGYKAYIDGRVDFYHHADPKNCMDQNYAYFVRKWTEKGLYRGLMLCRYPGGQRGYLPNFGP
jgi:dienelactone hydrolase